MSADQNYEEGAHTGEQDCPLCMADIIAGFELGFPEMFEGEQAEGVAALVQAWLEANREFHAQGLTDPELDVDTTVSEWVGTMFNALMHSPKIYQARNRMYAKHPDRYVTGITDDEPAS